MSLTSARSFTYHSLFHNQIGDRGAEALGQALQVNQKLQSLRLATRGAQCQSESAVYYLALAGMKLDLRVQSTWLKH